MVLPPRVTLESFACSTSAFIEELESALEKYIFTLNRQKKKKRCFQKLSSLSETCAHPPQHIYASTHQWNDIHRRKSIPMHPMDARLGQFQLRCDIWTCLQWDIEEAKKATTNLMEFIPDFDVVNIIIKDFLPPCIYRYQKEFAFEGIDKHRVSIATDALRMKLVNFSVKSGMALIRVDSSLFYASLC